MILYENNPFLKKCPLEAGVRYREVSQYLQNPNILVLWRGAGVCKVKDIKFNRKCE